MKGIIFAVVTLCLLSGALAAVTRDSLLGTYIVNYDTCNATCGYAQGPLTLTTNADANKLTITGTLTGTCTGLVDAAELCTVSSGILSAYLTCNKLS